MDISGLLNETGTAQWFLNFALQSFMVVASTWSMVKLFRRVSAPVRSGIVLSAMVILLLLPFGNHTLKWQETIIPTTPKPLLNKDGARPPMEINPTISTRDEKKENPSIVKNTSATETQINFSTGIPSTFSNNSNTSWWENNIVQVSNGLFIICLLGSFFLLLRFIMGLNHVRGFKRGMQEVHDDRVIRILTAVPGMFGKTALPQVYISPSIKSPLTMGIFKPCIIIPDNLYLRIEQEELKSLLLHEMAHIYHNDQWLGIIQRLVIILNWWNPLVYSISAEFSRAREYISDNYAIMGNGSNVYARNLFNLAKKANLAWNLPASMGMATPHISLEDRIKQIISKDRKMQTRIKRPVFIMLALGAILLAVVFAGYQWTLDAEQQAVVPFPVNPQKTGTPTRPDPASPVTEKSAAQHRLAKKTASPFIRKLGPKPANPVATVIGTIHQAVRKNDIIAVEALANADVKLLEKRDEQGFTPLFIALDRGNARMAKMLIKLGADVSIKGYRGLSMLHMAARCGDTELIKSLLKQGLMANGRDKDGTGPLDLLCESNIDNAEAAKLLLENGADVNPKHKKKLSPLAMAVAQGHKKITRLLVEQGANVNAKGKKVSAKMNKKKRNMDRPSNEILFNEVVIWGDPSLTRLFIQKGAHVNAQDGNGNSPLFYAKKYQHQEIQELLLAKGAK